MSVPAVELTHAPDQDQTSAQHDLQFGGIVVDKRAQLVSVDGRPVTLTPRELSLFIYFSEHTGRLLTRRQIAHEVWGEHYGGGLRTVDIHVSRLRKKLGSDLPLDTLRRLGYRFGSRSE